MNRNNRNILTKSNILTCFGSRTNTIQNDWREKGKDRERTLYLKKYSIRPLARTLTLLNMDQVLMPLQHKDFHTRSQVGKDCRFKS